MSIKSKSSSSSPPKPRASSAPKRTSKPATAKPATAKPATTKPAANSKTSKPSTNESSAAKPKGATSRVGSTSRAGDTGTKASGKDNVSLSREAAEKPTAEKSERANSLAASMKSAFSNDAGTKTETRGISVDSIEPASAPKNEASTSKDQASPKPAEGATSSGAAKNEDGSGPQGVAKPADAAKDQAKGASEDKPAEPSSEPNAPNSDGDEASKNKENRSVFVVDNFKDKEIDIDGDGTPDAAHGEVIARGLENQDFNVNRVKMGDRTISDALKDLNGKFESGKLPFKKGDVVNLSLGAGGDPSFETVRNALGVDVTPENVASKRGELFDALQRLPQEGPIPHILSINNSIKSLQKKGLEVVHSSGNDGSDKVSLGFLNAKHQLSATDAKGQIQSFSANHALTKPAQGVFGVTEVKGPNGQVSGFDVGGDGTQDFKASEVSGKGKRVSKPDASGSVSTIAGTSFSVLDFLQKQLPAN